MIKNNIKINKQSQYFTLVELLIVIAILAVLISLLQPALMKAIYKARTVACATKLKNIGTGILMYCDDNADVYPTDTECYHFNCSQCDNDGVRLVKATASLSSSSFNKFKGANATHFDLVTPMKPYFRGDLKPGFQCPHILDQREMGSNTNSYQLYFRTAEKRHIDTPMLKLGERWQLNDHNRSGDYRGKWFNIIAADLVQSSEIRNPWYHESAKPTDYNSADWPVWFNSHIPHESERVPFLWEGRAWNKGIPGQKTSTDTYTVSYRFSNQYAEGNFLHDDGAVLNIVLAEQDPETARMTDGRHFPGDHARDNP